MMTPPPSSSPHPSPQYEDEVLKKRIILPNSQKSAIIITINRPDRLNCFNTEVCHKLAQTFYDVAEEIQRNDINVGENEHADQNNNISAVIFTGQGPSFCAGADLSDPPNPLAQSSDLPHHLRWNPVYQMTRVGVPIIGALKGHVITGGFELALACDILLGDPTTTFRDTHVKFGLAPCWGLSQKLSQRISPGRAKIVSFSAKPLKAEKAYEWGLLDELVDGSLLPPFDQHVYNKFGIDVKNGDHALRRAIELADSIGSNDSAMVRRYKRAIVEGGNVDFQKGLQRERELGMAHYIEVVGDGTTFEGAKGFIADENRHRAGNSKL